MKTLKVNGKFKITKFYDFFEKRNVFYIENDDDVLFYFDNIVEAVKKINSL